MKNTTTKVAAVALAALAVSAFPSVAWATDGDFGAATTTANQILRFLTGPIATAAGAVAIAITGYRWFSGRMEMGRAVAIVAGIVLVLGSVQIVNMIRSGTGIADGIDTGAGGGMAALDAVDAPVAVQFAELAPVRLTDLV